MEGKLIANQIWFNNLSSLEGTAGTEFLDSWNFKFIKCNYCLWLRCPSPWFFKAWPGCQMQNYWRWLEEMSESCITTIDWIIGTTWFVCCIHRLWIIDAAIMWVTYLWVLGAESSTILYTGCNYYMGLLWWLFLNQTPIFEWYMARLVVKNGHQKDYNEIGLCAQNEDIIPGFAADTSRRVAYVIA